MQNQACLWTPAELSGWLDKKGSGYRTWSKRFFILKGSGLFYFTDLKATSARGVIPIELAKVEASTDKSETDRFLIKVWVSSAYQDIAKHRRYTLSSSSSQVQATWVTLLWYASVPRPDMLAQLHASGQLQSLLLKYMQAAYERMQQTAVQGGTVRSQSALQAQIGTWDPAAMECAMQLMSEQDPSAAMFAGQLDDEGPQQPVTNPAVMQRLSVMARQPADSPSLRPFNMLGTPAVGVRGSSQPRQTFGVSPSAQPAYAPDVATAGEEALAMMQGVAGFDAMQPRQVQGPDAMQPESYLDWTASSASTAGIAGAGPSSDLSSVASKSFALHREPPEQQAALPRQSTASPFPGFQPVSLSVPAKSSKLKSSQLKHARRSTATEVSDSTVHASASAIAQDEVSEFAAARGRLQSTARQSTAAAAGLLSSASSTMPAHWPGLAVDSQQPKQLAFSNQQESNSRHRAGKGLEARNREGDIGPSNPFEGGAKSAKAKPSIAQRIRSSIFVGKAASELAEQPAQASQQALLRMSAAYGFIATSPGAHVMTPPRPSFHPSHQRQSTFPAASRMSAVQPRNSLQDKRQARPSSSSDAMSFSPQARASTTAPSQARASGIAPSQARASSIAPAQQAAAKAVVSGEKDRGRAPQADPTGSEEEDPLSQVIKQQRAALKPVAAQPAPSATPPLPPKLQPEPMLEPLLSDQQQPQTLLSKQAPLQLQRQSQQHLPTQHSPSSPQQPVQRQQPSSLSSPPSPRSPPSALPASPPSPPPPPLVQSKPQQLHQEQHFMQQAQVQAPQMQSQPISPALLSSLQEQQLQQQQPNLQQVQPPVQQQLQQLPQLQQQHSQQLLSSDTSTSVAHASNSPIQSASPDSIDAELQSLIQQHKAALRHLEGLSGRRALLRSGSASSPGSAALPTRGLLSRATIPHPTPTSPLSTQPLLSRWTSPNSNPSPEVRPGITQPMLSRWTSLSSDPSLELGFGATSDARFTPSLTARPHVVAPQPERLQGFAESPVWSSQQASQAAFARPPQPNASVTSRLDRSASTASVIGSNAGKAVSEDSASNSSNLTASNSNARASETAEQFEGTVAASTSAAISMGVLTGTAQFGNVSAQQSNSQADRIGIKDSSRQPTASLQDRQTSPSSLQEQLASVKLRKQNAAAPAAAPKPNSGTGHTAVSLAQAPKQAPPPPPRNPPKPPSSHRVASNAVNVLHSQINTKPVRDHVAGTGSAVPLPPPPPPPPHVLVPRTGLQKAVLPAAPLGLTQPQTPSSTAQFSGYPRQLSAMQPMSQQPEYQQKPQAAAAQASGLSRQVSAMQSRSQQEQLTSTVQDVLWRRDAGSYIRTPSDMLQQGAAVQQQDAQVDANRPVRKWPAVQTNPLFQSNSAAVSASPAPLMPGQQM